MEAAQLMRLQKSSLATLYEALLVLEEGEKLLKSDEDTGDGNNNVENMIQKVLDMPAVNANTKRQRSLVPKSHTNSQMNAEAPETDLDDLDGALDPALLSTRLGPRKNRARWSRNMAQDSL